MKSRFMMGTVLLLVAAGLVFAAGQGEGTVDGEPVPVMLWMPGAAQEDQAMVTEAAKEYAGSRIGAYPDLQWFGWGEWADKKQLAIQSGEEMDIVFTANWNNYFNEIARNAWLPLNDLIDTHAPSLHETVGYFLQGPVKDGQILAIPTVKEGAGSVQWIFNKSLVDEYGVPVAEIKTPQDLEPWLEVIQENEPDVIPYLQWLEGIPGFPVQTSWEGIVGINDFFYDPNVGIRFFWNIDEVWELTPVARDWFLRGFFQPEVEDVAESGSEKYLTEGSFFAYYHVGHPGKINELSAQYGYEFIGSGPVAQPIAGGGFALGAMHAIARTSSKSIEAIKVLELMNADQRFNNLLNYGIEGEHFTFVDESAGIIEPIAESGYAPNMQWALQNQFLTYLRPNEDPDKWDRYRAFNESARIGDLVGFVADVNPVRSQIAAITNVMQQYDHVLSAGLAEPSEVRDEFMDALKSAGMDDVEAEIGRQVDEFLAGK